MGEEKPVEHAGITIDWGKEIQSLKTHIHPPVPNPAPLGLIGFGLTTALLQMKNTRIAGETSQDMKGVDTVTMGFAMFFGGVLQLVAGISEIKRNNLFGYTAFCLYGGFWMSIGTIDIVSYLATNSPPLSKMALQSVLFMVSIFTFMLWTLTFKINKTICSLFVLLGITCMLLCFGVNNETIDKVGGYFGILTSANAFWLAYVELVNDIIGEGKEIIPLGHWRWNPNPHSGGVHATGRVQPRMSMYMPHHPPSPKGVLAFSRIKTSQSVNPQHSHANQELSMNKDPLEKSDNPV